MISSNFVKNFNETERRVASLGQLKLLKIKIFTWQFNRARPLRLDLRSCLLHDV